MLWTPLCCLEDYSPVSVQKSSAICRSAVQLRPFFRLRNKSCKAAVSSSNKSIQAAAFSSLLHHSLAAKKVVIECCKFKYKLRQMASKNVKSNAAPATTLVQDVHHEEWCDVPRRGHYCFLRHSHSSHARPRLLLRSVAAGVMLRF